MYDRVTETWWQQFGGRGLTGDLAGTRLRRRPARIVSWDASASAHPMETVVSGPWFAARNEVFVEHGGEAVAVPLSVLRGGRTVRVGLGGRELTVRIVGGGGDVRSGGRNPSHRAVLVRVAAFRPNVRVAR